MQLRPNDDRDLYRWTMLVIMAGILALVSIMIRMMQ